MATPRLSTISSIATSPITSQPSRPISSPFDDIPEIPMPESPILGEAGSLMGRDPSTQDLRIMLTPTSPTSPSLFDDARTDHETGSVSDKAGQK
jgi:hypothetical protein